MSARWSQPASLSLIAFGFAFSNSLNFMCDSREVDKAEQRSVSYRTVQESAVLDRRQEVQFQLGGEFIGEIQQVKVSSGFLLVVDRFVGQQVYLFDRNGLLVAKIGEKGQGPGEYIYPVAAPIIDGKIYIASIGTQRMEVFDLEGRYLRSFSLASLGVGMWRDITVDSQKRLYLLNPTRYTKYSIVVIDTSGQEINSFAPIEEDFKGVFDTFAPASAFFVDQSNRVYQVFNHKYQIIVRDADGQLKQVLRLHSPFYQMPNYERALKVRGIQNEKEFRATFTQVTGVYVVEPRILVVNLRNWKSTTEPIEVVEFWDFEGPFLARYQVPEGEQLMTVVARQLVFKREGRVDARGIVQNPTLIFRQPNFDSLRNQAVHNP